MRKPWDFEEPLCAEVGTDPFFARDPDDIKSGLGHDNYREARKICSECVHVTECAEWGIAYEKHGMWGGLTPSDRANIRKRTNKVYLPAPAYRVY